MSTFAIEAVSSTDNIYKQNKTIWISKLLLSGISLVPFPWLKVGSQQTPASPQLTRKGQNFLAKKSETSPALLQPPPARPARYSDLLYALLLACRMAKGEGDLLYSSDISEPLLVLPTLPAQDQGGPSYPLQCFCNGGRRAKKIAPCELYMDDQQVNWMNVHC